MDHSTPSLAQGKTPEPERRRSFSALEMSFFDTGVAIETGEVSLPDEPPRDPDPTWRRWVLRRAGLVVGGACGLLLMVGVWVGAGTESATPPGTIQRPAIMVPIEDSPPMSPPPSRASQRSARAGSRADTSRSVKTRGPGSAQPPSATGPRSGQDTPPAR